MADVWLAHDAMLDRRVALKFLQQRYAEDQQFVERFRREASAAAGLQHPNVVGVFDRGTFDGSHYIAMEYVEGASLKDLIDRGLSVGEAVEITRQVLAGARFSPRERVFDAVIDKVEVKTLGELSPREIEHDNPEIRRTEDMASFLSQLYNREVTPDDTVTVIRFSQIKN